MAVVYENTGEVIRLTQTRTGFRVAVYVVGVFWVIGAALMAFMAGHRTDLDAHDRQIEIPVARIDLRSRYAGRGQRGHELFAVFKDETEALLWTPAAVMMSTLEQRVAEIRALVGRA